MAEKVYIMETQNGIRAFYTLPAKIRDELCFRYDYYLAIPDGLERPGCRNDTFLFREKRMPRSTSFLTKSPLTTYQLAPERQC